MLLSRRLLLSPLSTELSDFAAFARGAPACLLDMGLFCLGGALGQTFVFRSLGSFGSITLVTITVTRKLFTIILSVLLYGHAVSNGQWLAVAVVFAGILIEAFPPKFLVRAAEKPKHEPKQL